MSIDIQGYGSVKWQEESFVRRKLKFHFLQLEKPSWRTTIKRRNQ